VMQRRAIHRGSCNGFLFAGTSAFLSFILTK
jgi:hypothetical protein